MSRFASCSLGERRFAALVDGDAVRPLSGVSELGRETPAELLADPPLNDERVPLADVTLRPVIPNPGKIVCVGLNYKAHVDEGVFEVPDYPALFPKYADALVGAGQPVLVPPESEAADFEAELAFVVGRRVRRARGDEALAAVGGYTIANDVTMRDYQYKTHQWLQGKTWAGSTPLGPFLVTPDEVGDPHALDISLELNGERMQDANTSAFIFDIPALVATISEFVPLEPGRRRADRHAERRRLPARPEGAAARRRPHGGRDRERGAAREPGGRRGGLSSEGSGLPGGLHFLNLLSRSTPPIRSILSTTPSGGVCRCASFSGESPVRARFIARFSRNFASLLSFWAWLSAISAPQGRNPRPLMVRIVSPASWPCKLALGVTVDRATPTGVASAGGGRP